MLELGRFRRRFINDQFSDVVAIPLVRDLKQDYEAPVRQTLREGSTLSHYPIDSEYRAAETPDWVYELFAIKRP